MLIYAVEMLKFASILEGAGFVIEAVKGIKTIFFGGEGLFLTTLRGPGKIIIQSMTLTNLATDLAPFLPGTHSKTSGSSGVVGTLLRETIGR